MKRMARFARESPQNPIAPYPPEMGLLVLECPLAARNGIKALG